MPQREIERAYNFSMPVFIFPVKIKNAEISLPRNFHLTDQKRDRKDRSSLSLCLDHLDHYAVLFFFNSYRKLIASIGVMELMSIISIIFMISFCLGSSFSTTSICG